MERVPERIGVAGDWHGNTAWATRAVRKISALLPADGPRVIVHLGDFGIWPGPVGQEYLSRLDAALAAADAELWFVDGNHEDFTQLARLRPGPDGRAQVTARIWHLPRGHRWRWHGRDWLALGGAVSLDRAGRTEGTDWWPEEEITRPQARSVMEAGPADVMVTHECPAGIEHAFLPPPPWWSPADLRRSDAHRALLREVVLAVRPRWLMHGHLHLSYQRQVDLGYGPIEVTGLDSDGAESGNWAILDVTSMRWLRFAGRPISNALRSMVSLCTRRRARAAPYEGSMDHASSAGRPRSSADTGLGLALRSPAPVGPSRMGAGVVGGARLAEVGAMCGCRGRLAVQRSVQDLESLQYQRMSAQAWPPSGIISPVGSAIPHNEH